MTTIITLLLMLVVFSGFIYAFKLVWSRLHRSDLAEADDGIPLYPMLFLSSVAGMLAVAAGFTFIHLLNAHAPYRKLTSGPSVTVRPLDLQRVTRADLVAAEPRMKVLIDDRSDDVPLPDDVLSRCSDFEITYVKANGEVSCITESSKEARQLLQRTEQPEEVQPVPKALPLRSGRDLKQQSFLPAVSTTPSEVAKDVAARNGIHKYAEVVYFVLTFFGVFLRLCWDATQTRRRGRKPPLLTLPTLITSLVLAITVYALIIQSGLAGTSNLLNFKTGIFAVYNGLVSSSLIRDLKLVQAGARDQPTPST